MEFLIDLWYLVPLLFIAGVLDGIAGGGGIIAFPAYMMTGMPIYSVYACNKLQSGLGTLCSCLKYAKEKFIDIKVALLTIPTTILSSFLITKLVMSISEDTIKIIIAICLPIAVILMFLKRKMGSQKQISHKLTAKTVLLALLSGAILGAYDALFGPGGGTIAVMVFSLLLNYDLRVGSGNGKLIIVASNITAVINYIASGHMIWHVALPCSLANMIGSYIGAAIVVKKGEKIIFPAMLVVVASLIIQIILGFIQK